MYRRVRVTGCLIKKGNTYCQMAITLELTVQGDDAITNGFVHWSFSQAFVGSSGRLFHTKFSCRHMEGLCQALTTTQLIESFKPFKYYPHKFTWFHWHSVLSRKNTEYLFIVTGTVASSPSQTLLPSSTIKMSIRTQYQVVHHYGSIKTFYISHSCRNYFFSCLSVKKIYHSFLNKSFFMVYRNHIGPRAWRESQKVPWLLTDGRICLAPSKLMSSCLSICYLTTTVYKMLKQTSRPPSKTWESYGITGKAKYKRKKEKLLYFYVHEPETVGYLPQATWRVSINVRIWAWGPQVHRSKPSACISLLRAERKGLFKACHCEPTANLKKTQLVTSSDRTLTLISNGCKIKH